MKRLCVALILALATYSHAESIGRLFFTPEQRLLLDNARRQKVKVEEQTVEPAPEIVSLNGMVKRDDGHTTVWLNNRAVSDRKTTGGVTIHPQGSASDPVLFTIPQAERVVTLRVGQNLDVTTGQVVEPYSPKAAEMKRVLAEKQEQAAPASKPDSDRVPGRTRTAGAEKKAEASPSPDAAESKALPSLQKATH
jgi:hypothetical protein